MDYVYICRNGKNEELKYSLRSVEKNMQPGNVWVVGYRPDWYIGNFIKAEDIGKKFENIRNCIKIISENNNISENFVLMNDDFFAIKPISNLENFHGGLLKNKIERYKELRMSPKYIKLLTLTYNQLCDYGIQNPLDYDIHLPMIMNKKILTDALKVAFFPRSAYGNFAQIGGNMVSDVKIYSNNIIDFDNIENENMFVSTEDNSFLLLKNKILDKYFYKNSKFENPQYTLGEKYETI